MVAQVEGELLELDHLAKADIVDLEGTQEVTTKTLAALAGDQANLPSHSLATSCIIFLLNAGDWDSVTKLSHANMPYIVASRNSAQATVFQLARNLAFLMHNMRGNNLPIVKKFGKDVWDALSHLCSSAAGKRKEGQGGAAARERALVASFLGRWLEHFLYSCLIQILPQGNPPQPPCLDPLPTCLSAQRGKRRPGDRGLLSSRGCLAHGACQQCLIAGSGRGNVHYFMI